jgi:hypothetical protein
MNTNPRPGDRKRLNPSNLPEAGEIRWSAVNI